MQSSPSFDFHLHDLSPMTAFCSKYYVMWWSYCFLFTWNSSLKGIDNVDVAQELKLFIIIIIIVNNANCHVILFFQLSVVKVNMAYDIFFSSEILFPPKHTKMSASVCFKIIFYEIIANTMQWWWGKKFTKLCRPTWYAWYTCTMYR